MFNGLLQYAGLWSSVSIDYAGRDDGWVCISRYRGQGLRYEGCCIARYVRSIRGSMGEKEDGNWK
jgi:hypothetical protein